ncbi:hypothetical protein D5086_019934 [Populus alba]|uniref:Uncharacterized protein n=1 Tax=Populus alba TaxID=43335 RepID=A0ACC4BIN2_POPAL
MNTGFETGVSSDSHLRCCATNQKWLVSDITLSGIVNHAAPQEKHELDKVERSIPVLLTVTLQLNSMSKCRLSDIPNHPQVMSNSLQLLSWT